MDFIARPVRKMKGDAVTLIETSGYPNLVYAFDQVKRIAQGVFPELADAQLGIGCPHGRLKHSHHQIKDSDKSGRNWRAFMHTNHFTHVVCVHPHADTELEVKRLVGMFAHEFGHMIADIVKVKNTQKAADKMARQYLGIDIYYTEPGRIQTAGAR